MPRPQTVRERERARQRAQEAARLQRQAAARRQKKVLALVVIVLALALVAGFFGIRSETETASTTTASTTPTTAAGPPVAGTAELPRPPAGETLSGETPCPALDGSSPRVTTFAGPPPMCIDPALTYQAVMRTSAGELTFLLNTDQSINAVNNFVVLSLYHYYDGQPFTSVISRESAVVAPRFENTEPSQSPGYTIPGDANPTIWTTGQIGMVPSTATTTDYGATFVIATFELAAGLPENLTQFGLMLDGAPVLQALEKTASQTGPPTEVITIDSITITTSTPAP
jgi:cyclophilin family peptidyl-prolyl cis-trans isomerase